MSSKHHAIFETIHADILQGRYAAGSRLPSEESLCRKWKVSRPTVARALHDIQALGLVERRAGSGTYVRVHVQSTRPTLGIFAEGLGKTEILDPICAEITRSAQERGCAVFTGGLPHEQSPRDLAKHWEKNGVRGVIFAPLENIPDREPYNLRVAKAFQEAGMSVILIDRDATEFPFRSNYDLISMDNFQAGCLIGKHLAESQRYRVAFVAKPNFPSSTNLRLAGIREGLGEKNFSPVDFFIGDPEEADFVKKITHASSPYAAVVCSNDLTAAQLLKTSMRLGKTIPEDFLLTGFDDVRYATLLPVPLTTIRQPCREIGITCIDTLLTRLEHPKLPPRAIFLTGQLIIRTSTTPSR